MQTEPEVISPDTPDVLPFPSNVSVTIERADGTQEDATASMELVVNDSADRIARLEAEVAALHKQRDAEKQIADAMEDARRDWEDLKDRAKAAKERFDTLAEALAKLVRGDVQTEVGEFSDAAGPKQTTLADAISDAPAQPMTPDALTIPDMDWGAVELAALSAVSSLGKAPQVKPYETKTGNLLVLTDVSRPIAVMHEALDAKAFAARYPQGQMFDTPSLHGGFGNLLGYPVRCGRKKLWLGSNDDAWHVAIPEEVKISAAAGIMDDSGDGDPNEADADDTSHDELAESPNPSE